MMLIINNNIKQAYIRMTDQRQQKSAAKSGNPKIGRPAKTDQEEQFKQHYLENRKKFQLQCQLLVYIHHIFFEQIPTHPANSKVQIAQVARLFELYGCLALYKSLAHLNELYYKNSSVFPEQKLRYTSIIDVGYFIRQAKVDNNGKISSYQLVLLVLFFLYNEKVVNPAFFEYFRKRVEVFRNGMINGPDNCQLNKMDTLIITLALEVAVRQGLLIEEQVEDQSQIEQVSSEKTPYEAIFSSPVGKNTNRQSPRIQSQSEEEQEEMEEQMEDECRMESVDLGYRGVMDEQSEND